MDWSSRPLHRSWVVLHVAVSAWCSTHQLPGCECAVKVLHALLRYLYIEYMGIYGYIKAYIHVLNSIHKFHIYIIYIIYAPLYTYLHANLYFTFVYIYIIYIYRCILACICISSNTYILGLLFSWSARPVCYLARQKLF